MYAEGKKRCEVGHESCLQQRENEIQFISPMKDKTYYHKKIRIHVDKSLIDLFTDDTAFCFTLYNLNTTRSLDKCYTTTTEILEVVHPKHISVGGLGEGVVELAAWLKDQKTEMPIESTWISYSFMVSFECISRFDSVPTAFMEMEQVDLEAVALQLSPHCYNLWKNKVKGSRRNINMIEYESVGIDSKNGMHNGLENTSEGLLRKYLDVKSASRGVFGVQFYEQSFGHGDRIFLDFILSSKPQYSSFVEFGTFKGLTSLYLGMSSKLRRNAKKFRTFDIKDFRQPHIVTAWMDNMEFTIANLEQIPLNQEAVKSVLDADFLFVDGGNKHVEAVLYAGLMKVGSGIFIHDYQYENEDFDAPTKKFLELEEMGFSPYYEAAALLFNSCGRFWIKEGDKSSFDLRIWLTKLGCASVTHCDVSKTWANNFGL